MQNRSRLAGRQYLVMMCVWIIAGVIMGIFGLSRFLNYYSSHTIAELEFLIPVLVLLVMDRFEVLRGTKMKVLGIRSVLWTALFTALLMPVIYFLNALSQLVVPNSVEASVEYFASITGYQVWNNPLWLNLLFIAVVPAVVEEYIFRCVLYQGFRRCGLLKTALLTALMFGLAHGNLNQFLYAFAVGIFFVYLNEAAGTVYASMLAHTLINASTVFLSFLETRLPENVTSAMVVAESEAASVSDLSLVFWIILGVIAGACMILAVIVIRTIAKTAGREKVYTEARKGKDRLKGAEGRVFSVELLIGLLIPVVYIGITMIIQLGRH